MHNGVVVIGLGAAGSYAALQLALANVPVIGLEADDLVHPRGAYAGESRLFRAAYHEGSEYLPLLIESRREWLNLQSTSERSLFLQTGVLSIGSETAPQMAQVIASLERADVDHEVLTATELRQRFPQHSRITDEIGVFDRLGGVLRPEAAVSEIQLQARNAGADLREAQRVVAISEHEDGVSVRLESGEIIAARSVIISAGVHTASLVPCLADHISIRPISLTWFCPEHPGAFAPDRFPAFIRDFGTTHLFGVPSLDGSLVKAGYDARFGSIPHPRDLPSALTRHQRSEIAADVHDLISDLPPHVARESMHMDSFTSDKRPIVGRVSERMIVGTGFSGHGFKMAPAFGNALAALAAGHEPQHDITNFSPLRFAS